MKSQCPKAEGLIASACAWPGHCQKKTDAGTPAGPIMQGFVALQMWIYCAIWKLLALDRFLELLSTYLVLSHI